MSKRRLDVEAEALRDLLRNTEKMQMTVALDNGLYRHLKFRGGDHSYAWLDVITWPGCLTVNGDYGTWCFARIDDMFAFFRSRDGQLRINASYWREKLLACDRNTGNPMQFVSEVFRQQIIDSIDGYGIEDKPKKWRKALIEALDEEVFCHETEHETREALNDFKHDGFEFSDTWEIDGKAYTFRYIYNLYAIVWAIQQYDAMKADADTRATAEVTR